MKLTPILVAAAGVAMLAACTVENADNAAGNADANAAVPAREAPAPAADDAAGADTLGNQLNQLQESDAEASNSSD